MKDQAGINVDETCHYWQNTKSIFLHAKINLLKNACKKVYFTYFELKKPSNNSYNTKHPNKLSCTVNVPLTVLK